MGTPIKITSNGMHYLLHAWEARQAWWDLSEYDKKQLIDLGFIVVKDSRPELTNEGAAQINRIYTK